MKNENDVVITGLGMVSPVGSGIQAFTDSLLKQKSGIQLRDWLSDTAWPFRIGGIVNDYDPKKFVKPRKSLKLMCREIQFGFGAAQMAVEDSGLDVSTVHPMRVGVVCGSDTFYCDPNSVTESYSQNGELIHDLSTWLPRVAKTVEPLWMLKYLPNMIASHIAIGFDARGPNNSIVQGDISGLLAIIEAADFIRRGWTDVMIAGGTGSKINPIYLSYHGIENLADPGEDPARACRPFDEKRTGSVVGEGAGMILLERRDHAEKRGARIYATVSAYDFGWAGPDRPSQIRLISRTIDNAIEKAGLDRSMISHVNSYASGEIESDQNLAQAIHHTLGDVGVTAYKSSFGDMGPAGATIETCAAVEALYSHRVAGTINFKNPDELCPVNVIAENMEKEQTAALKISNSNTGQIGTLLLTAE